MEKWVLAQFLSFLLLDWISKNMMSSNILKHRAQAFHEDLGSVENVAYVTYGFGSSESCTQSSPPVVTADKQASGVATTS